MARKRHEKGQLWLEGEIWSGRWREDVLVDGARKRVRVQKEIGTHRDYPTKRLAQRELDRQIEHVNDLSYRPRPTARFTDVAKKWERDVLNQSGESTAINYRTHIRKHLVPFFAAETGLRPGELCGLTVDALDLERGATSSATECVAGKIRRSENRRFHPSR